MKYILYTILFLTVVISCKKQSMVVIQAQNYTNTTDGSAYAGMKYTVLESWTPVFDLKTNKIATGTLDANGHASFDIKMKNNRKYDLGIQKPENMCYTEITIQERLKHEDNNTINFEYAQCAYSKLILNNINCNGINDKLILYQADDLKNIDNISPWEHKGCVYWESPGGTDGSPIGYSTITYGNVYYKWVVTKNGITNTYYDTVFYPVGEFTTFQIDY